MATNQHLRITALYLGLLALVACERAPVPQPPGILSPTPSSTITVQVLEAGSAAATYNVMIVTPD